MMDTPMLGIAWCPDCEPDRDPLREILDLRRCAAHPLIEAGDADHVVQPDVYLLGGTEAGGDDNRRFCALVHRSRR